ncbi:BA75_03010T0 [Komagataella pastoris]|uniref:phosphoserine phosphatase n=1 Tax=Komagataella pastoris TaxID=4922 RepID=A0A1B2JD54_PICPA|nr:BA75_03010T0 [Komagataella pastoris]
MSYRLTAISKAKSFPDGSIDKIRDFVRTLHHAEILGISMLSPNKALDLQLEIKDCCDGNHLDSTKNAVRSAQIEGVDLVFNELEARKNIRLVVFDMDSTLIQQEVIELIAAKANVESEVEKITTAAMNGELDFKQSLAQRVKLLRGIESADLWNSLKPQLKFTPGARELCKGLKKAGIKLAVLSGGFVPLAEYVSNELGLDYAYANTLKTEVDASGKETLSGSTIGEVVDGARKAELLKEIATKNDIPFSSVLAVGDGANDLPMMKVAGLGVAWNAKPKVQEQAPAKLNSESLADIFYILGYSDIEIEGFLNE